ncbi:MAG TPA: hypothetical protein PLS83_03450, partial [Methanothrix soehngenii]|nr:hypothetical protein [Methanothrix soehngenii]
LQTPWRQKISPLCHPGSGGSSSSFWFISVGPGIRVDLKAMGDRLEGDWRSTGVDGRAMEGRLDRLMWTGGETPAGDFDGPSR